MTEQFIDQLLRGMLQAQLAMHQTVFDLALRVGGADPEAREFNGRVAQAAVDSFIGCFEGEAREWIDSLRDSLIEGLTK